MTSKDPTTERREGRVKKSVGDGWFVVVVVVVVVVVRCCCCAIDVAMVLPVAFSLVEASN